MKIKNKIASIKTIVKTKFFAQRIPLIVSWHLVNRCNKRCKYCYRWEGDTKELTTKEIFSIIDELSQMGTQAIIFSGGEPLLRDDIGGIINYSQRKGIFTGLTSNGSLVAQKINEIRNLDMLKLSLDGPEKIHDFIRGDGSYNEVMNAVRIAKENKLNIKFNTTLTKYHVDNIDFILEKARQLNIGVKFQPLSHVHSMDHDIDFLLPDEKRYKQTVQRLICLKRTNPFIINSTLALEYLYHLPYRANVKLKCYAGRLICCIAPNGDIFPCSAMRDKTRPTNCLEGTFKQAFHNLPFVSACKGCWCTSTLELNCLLRFNFKTIMNMRRLFA